MIQKWNHLDALELELRLTSVWNCIVAYQRVYDTKLKPKSYTCDSLECVVVESHLTTHSPDVLELRRGDKLASKRRLIPICSSVLVEFDSSWAIVVMFT